jgi:hypothetical protein
VPSRAQGKHCSPLGSSDGKEKQTQGGLGKDQGLDQADMGRRRGESWILGISTAMWETIQNQCS